MPRIDRVEAFPLRYPEPHDGGKLRHITLAPNPAFTLAPLDFAGTPSGIDIRKVVDTRILPVINTGIAHREAGVGQVGAGVTRAPMPCFAKAVLALAEEFR